MKKALDPILGPGAFFVPIENIKKTAGNMPHCF